MLRASPAVPPIRRCFFAPCAGGGGGGRGSFYPHPYPSSQINHFHKHSLGAVVSTQARWRARRRGGDHAVARSWPKEDRTAARLRARTGGGERADELQSADGGGRTDELQRADGGKRAEGTRTRGSGDAVHSGERMGARTWGRGARRRALMRGRGAAHGGQRAWVR
jgi:hypothetical protein